MPRNGATSRDEMNLAEFPLTVLSTRANSKLKTLEFSDHVYLKNGEQVQRNWVITGADKFGLPTSSDDEVLLGLLKLTVDAQARSGGEFKDRKIYFSRYELLRALRWTTEGRSYSRLTKALDRLSGVRIKATNAFYDNESKLHSTRNFGLIDAYEINDGRAATTKPSYFIWSETIFRSFRAGFIKKLDLDFYLDLRSAISKRLFRFLDKHFWYRSKFTVNVFVLAHEKVGISRNYRHLSSIRQHLDPAFEELIKAGFIAGVEYQGRGESAEVSILASSGARQKLSRGVVASNRQEGTGDSESSAPVLFEDVPPSARGSGQQLNLVKDSTAGQRSPTKQTRGEPRAGSEADEVSSCVRLLEERGIKSSQAHKLVASRTSYELKRVIEVVNYFDRLKREGSPLISRSPVGFLYRAIERLEHFILPGEIKEASRVVQKFSTGKEASSHPMTQTVPRNQSRTIDSLNTLESEYLIARKREIKSILGDIEPELLNRIRAEVELKMDKLRELISPPRFSEAVNHAVEEKLLKQFAFPTFEEFISSHKSRSV